MTGREAILIAGPTASGKSALARDYARRADGVVVNADSMQVHAGLSILTARPTQAEEREVPHRLYGHVPPAADYSAGIWLREAEAVLEDIRGEGRVPVFCGGTGLYFKALLGGLDEMPPVPAAIRSAWRARMVEEGPEQLHRLLAERDPATAANLRPSDPQRIVRALEIVEATGRPLAELQAGIRRPLVDPIRCLKIVIAPERALLRERIAARFGQMIEAGALEEVRRFLELPGAEGSVASKAIGISELAAVLRGEASLASAVATSVIRTRQYAKRQETWFRHQLGVDWLRVCDADAARSLPI